MAVGLSVGSRVDRYMGDSGIKLRGKYCIVYIGCMLACAPADGICKHELGNFGLGRGNKYGERREGRCHVHVGSGARVTAGLEFRYSAMGWRGQIFFGFL